MNVVNVVKSAYNAAKLFGKNHKAAILMGTGIVAGVTAVVKCVQDTKKAEKSIKEAEEQKRKDIQELREEVKEELNDGIDIEVTDEECKLKPTEVIKACWKDYVPTALMTAMFITCCVGSATTYHKRYIALASAYSVAESMASELPKYKTQIEKILGKENADKVEQAVKEQNDIQSKVVPEPVKNQTKTIINTGRGTDLCYDPYSGRWFYSDHAIIEKAVNNLNHKITATMEMVASLNDFYTEIGLEPIKLGDEVGWRLDAYRCIFTPYSELSVEGKPVLVIAFQYEPINLFA